MKLIAILLSLSLEHYLHIGKPLKRFAWFDKYLRLFKTILPGAESWRGAIGLLAIVAPLLIVIAILYYLLAGWLFGLVGLIISFVVLIYCLGPESIAAQLDHYFKAAADNNQPAMLAQSSALLNEIKEAAAIPQALSQHILEQFNRQTFAVIFWFVILGESLI